MSKRKYTYHGFPKSKAGPSRTWASKGKAHVYAQGRSYAGRYANGGELKFHDIDVNEATGDWSGGIIMNGGTLNIIAQGSTESQRIGRKCTIKSIMMRANLNLQALAAATAQPTFTVRYIIYLDKQCNGLTAAVTDILESADYLSFRNLSNVSRFNIIKDKTFEIKPNAAAGDGTTNDFGASAINFTCFKKCNIPLEYDNSATTGVLTSIRSNNIGMLLISRGSGALMVLDAKFRMRFSDS